MPGTILVVDDEPKIVDLLRAYLERAGYRVETAQDGPGALSAFGRSSPALVLLDLMLPGMDGLDVCRHIRRQSDVPVIMITARAEEVDRLIGLELGADDYVVKPLSPREVVARVRTVLRRVEARVRDHETIRAGTITIDPARRTVDIAGHPVELTPSEFNLLSALARQPGRVFTRLQLLQQMQAETLEGYERTVDVHVKNLRRKIEPDPRAPRHLLTVYGVGYKLVEAPDVA